jgi:hypothetical protein
MICALSAVFAGSAFAQAPAAADPNPGAITLTTGIDFPSVYFFRGIRQEADPELTVFPYGDVGVALWSGSGPIKSGTVNFGVWNSLNTGSSGTGSGVKTSHYEEDFYAKLTLGFARGVNGAVQYTAYTSPNGSFGTVKEILFTISHASKYAPYGTFAFELSGQADAGKNEGIYGEFGVGPSWPLFGGKATLGIPLKLGLSLKDYYEGENGDQTFGYFDAGALLTVPMSRIPSKFGSWNIHGSVDFLAFGGKYSTTRAFNNDDAGEVIVMGGIGLTY